MLLVFLLFTAIFECTAYWERYMCDGQIRGRGQEADFYENHPNIITSALRRVATGGSSADFTLVVYHKKTVPYEVTIDNIKERVDAPFYAIRLFMKPKKRMFVVYESKSSETILAEYQLKKNDLVNVGNENAGKYIETWRITDSEEGFYDAVECRMFGTSKLYPNCPCQIQVSSKEMCIYDYVRNVHEKIERQENTAYRGTFNIYNCLHFHEGENVFKWICDPYDYECWKNRNITALTYITHKAYLPNINYQNGICITAKDNTRQIQFYDLKWDIPGKLPEEKPRYCDLDYVLKVAKLIDETLPIPEEPNEEEPLPVPSESISIITREPVMQPPDEKGQCVSPNWTIALFCLDGVLILTITFVFLTGTIGRNAKRRKY